MPMTWDSQTDAKLLLGILHTSTTKIDYPALAEFMGSECTEIAVKRRIQRLKEQHLPNGGNTSNSNATSADAGEGSSSVPATPEKRKRGPKASGAKEKDGSAKTSPCKKSPSKKVKGEAAETGDLPAEDFGAKEME